MNNELNQEIIDAMSKVMRIMKHSASIDEKEPQVTTHQFEALWCIKKSKQAHMREIADHFSTTMPTATSLIDKLILAKLVRRRNDIKDRRIVKISLTGRGEHMLKDMARHRERKISKMLSYLSEKDKKDLLRILNTISEQAVKYES